MKGNVFLKSENQFAAHWSCLFANVLQFTTASYVRTVSYLCFLFPYKLEKKKKSKASVGMFPDRRHHSPLEAFGEVPIYEQGAETHSWSDKCGINGAFPVYMSHPWL